MWIPGFGRGTRLALLTALFVAILAPAAVAAESEMNGADTAWILTSTALVLFMTLPGLALFYGGLVQSRHVLSVLMHCFAIACVASLLWLAFVYSFAFGDGGAVNQWIGGWGKAFLLGIGPDTLSGSIPEPVFFMFQMTFAIITPALIVGAYPERIRFSVVVFFSAVWLVRPLACRPWCWQRCWADAEDFPARFGRRTTRAWPWPAPRCCGSVGSASTPAAPWPRTAAPPWP
jgi:Amt family ammonium transporter